MNNKTRDFVIEAVKRYGFMSTSQLIRFAYSMNLKKEEYKTIEIIESLTNNTHIHSVEYTNHITENSFRIKDLYYYNPWI